MEPGIYPNVPFDEYLAIQALSNTRMSLLAQSPRHFKFNAALDERMKCLVAGRLIHTHTLEPALLACRYAVMPDFANDLNNQTDKGLPSTSSQTRWCKEQVFNFESANSDREIVIESWWREALLTVESIRSDESSREIFETPGPTELTVVWDDPETGIRCKARIDKVAGPKLVDLKSTSRLATFTKSIASYDYHRQLAHYQAGYAALTGELLQPWIVAAETVPPYCIQSAPLHDEAVNCGESRRRKLLRLLRECLDADHWPGPPSPTSWRIPEWAMTDGEPIELIIDNELVEV
jgi:exodeoxyribonuclease VIII